GNQFAEGQPETRNQKPETVLIALAQLARPANIVTAWADVLAGVAVAGVTIPVLLGMEPGILPESVAWLVLATTGLYGGGVVFNDVFDAKLDAVERPERPIPSGKVSIGAATAWGLLLLIGGIVAAWQASWESGVLAAAIAVAALVYDKFGKHHTILGPINMGLCRGMNLMLGISVVPSLMTELAAVCILPLVYIGAITLISQGEVHGGTSKKGWQAVGLLGLVILSLIFISATGYSYIFLYGMIFIFFFVWLVAPPFIRAARKPDAPVIRKAVKAGILGLIPLNAAIASGFAGWEFGLFIVLLLPISIGLGKIFALT
ncbi:MAG: UbiA-like protein EboC, partial [Rhodothermaceae bacterium]|nr:UbiA-like protein EboC [Rhodothermaceae bacterium]